MTRTSARQPFGQPSLPDLMVRFLASRSDAAPAAAVEPTAEGEVEPHEVAAGFRVDPRAAWTDAAAALATVRGNLDPVPSALPPEWAGLVNQPTAAFAVPLAAGHFPQRVKDLHPLLTKFAPADLRPTGDAAPAVGLAGLRGWIGRQATAGPATKLLAAGVARTLGDLDTADALLADAEGDAAANERAATLWQRGRGEEALAAWERLPETAATLFNRGMATLFLGRPADARPLLTRAADLLPEAGGWQSLARLYLAVAEIHG